MSFARVRGPGHPDQLCDLVAAGIVEEYLRRDPQSRLNVRVVGGRGVLFLAGDILSSADFDVSSIAKRIVANSSISTVVEPFLAFESMSPGWGPVVGSREVVTVMGYATKETDERLPKCVALARDVARELERRRTMDEQWYWLGSDYEVTVNQWSEGAAPLIVLRVEHLETQSLLHVRTALTHLVNTRHPQAEVRVNVAGEESQAGVKIRMGASGRMSGAEQYGSLLPANGSGVGMHIGHPLNAGAWLCRQLARNLVSEGKGRAVMVQATWLPFDARASLVRVRNEKGQDLSKSIDHAQLDLAALPPEYTLPNLVTHSLQAPYDASVALPWEEKV